jgi:GT2 family glycosyltransferase
MRGVWDAVMVGTLGPGDNRFAWGGAMAIRKETFFEAQVAEYWKNPLSDDYALSAAVHTAGGTIAYAPGALVPCLEHITAARFFRWMRRQLTFTRVYNPRQWWPGLVAHILYCGGMTASATWIWLMGLAASAFGNTIEWRGSRYRLTRGPGIITT